MELTTDRSGTGQGLTQGSEKRGGDVAPAADGGGNGLHKPIHALPSVTIRFAGDDDTEKFLLGSREIAGTTDLTVYSPESALGAAITGAKPGASVTYQAPNGRDITVEVVAVEPFVP